jgi:hypothetical protein
MTRRLAGAALFLLGCNSPSINDVTFSTEYASQAVFSPDDRYSLEMVASFGSMRGPGALLKVGLAAAVNGDTLAVLDAGTCSVVFFEIATQGLLQRIGSCGEGPSEFGAITAIGFAGSRLVVYDHSLSTRPDSVDQESHRYLRLSDSSLSGRAVMGFAVQDSTFIANVSVRTRGDHTAKEYLVRGSLNTGRIYARLVSVPMIAKDSPVSLINTIGWCTRPDPKGELLIAVNQWHPEVGIWRGSPASPQVVIAAAGSFGRPRYYVREGENLPRFKRVRAACGQDMAVVSFEEIVGKGNRARVVLSYAVVEYSGNAFLLHPTDDARPSELGHPVAAVGNTFFFASPKSPDSQVRAFRVTRKQREVP